MDNTKLAWLAGLFDGEGTVGFYKARRRNGGFAYEKYLCINCGDTRIVFHASEILSELVGHPIIAYPDYRPSRLRPSVYWKVSVRRQNDIQQVLTYLTPYLVGKKTEALLLLNFLSTHKKCSPYTEAYNVVAEAIKIAKKVGFSQAIPNQAEVEQSTSGVCRDLTGDILDNRMKGKSTLVGNYEESCCSRRQFDHIHHHRNRYRQRQLGRTYEEIRMTKPLPKRGSLNLDESSRVIPCQAEQELNNPAQACVETIQEAPSNG